MRRFENRPDIDRPDIKLLAKIEQHLAKQTQMLEAMSLALVGQDKAVEAVMEMAGKEREAEHRDDVFQRGLSHEARLLEMLSDTGLGQGGPDDVQELPEREDA